MEVTIWETKVDLQMILKMTLKVKVKVTTWLSINLFFHHIVTSLYHSLYYCHLHYYPKFWYIVRDSLKSLKIHLLLAKYRMFCNVK